MGSPLTLCLSSPRISSGEWTAAAAEALLQGQEVAVVLGPELLANGLPAGTRWTPGGGCFFHPGLVVGDRAEAAAARAAAGEAAGEAAGPSGSGGGGSA